MLEKTKEDRKKRSYFEYCLLSFIKEDKEYFLDDFYSEFFKSLSNKENKNSKDKINNKFKYNIERSVTYLISKDFLNLKMKNDKNYIVLNKKGSLRREFLKNIFELNKKNLKKEGLFILIFNFDKNNKNTRDYIKTIVKNQGFKMVRDGVWSTEYALHSFVEALRDRYDLNKNELIFGEFSIKK